MNHPAIQKFMDDLTVLGYNPELRQDDQNQFFAILPGYTVEHGRFQGRVIDLGLPALLDYPRMVGPSMHIKADPQLLELQNDPGKLNVINSLLGSEWRYWSFRFVAHPQETAQQLMNQINTVFKNV
jgi:hypothetical protein